MRLSRRVSLLGRRENRRLKKRTKKKHKKLDDICENAYNLNHHHHHRSVEEETDNNNGGADVDKEAELRRSTRVRRAPVVLDASPSPAKKRRRVVEFKREKVESGGCSGSWGDRLRARAKKGKNRPRKRLFLNNDDVVGESSRSSSRRLSTVVKSRVKSAVLKNAHQEKRESSSDEGQFSDSNEENKVKSGSSSDHEENDEVEKGDESGEESEEGKSEAEIDEGETSESDEDGEESEKNEIENHIGEKVDTRDSSESDEDGEESEKNEIENHIGEKEDRKESSESDEEEGESEKNEIENHIGEKEDTRESSESDEEEGESEKNEIENHIGEKENTRESSESDEEEVEEENGDEDNNKRENEVKGDEENDEVVVLEDVEKVEVEDNRIKETDEDNRGSDNLEKMELDVQVELQNSIADGENKMDSLNVGGVSTDQIEIEKSNEKHLNEGIVKKSLRDANERRYLRVGRRCSLCGTGTDGKPPKTLVEDGNGSDHEVAYSGSSASEDVRYDTCDGFGADPGWLGRLLGPINDRHGIAGIFVHQHCAVWSPEVYFAGLNCLKNVRAALFRGRVLKCTRCSRPGATIGCRVDRCPKTYHLPCARANGCIFYHKKFLIACTDHRHLFQPHGVQYLHKIKKMKTKKLKLEMRKVSGDAWRKDHEAEEKYLENCGEDEEFLKRESKRLHRDLLRIAPVYIGGSSSDKESQFQGWESVAGLQNVIQSLKEVVILPLLYPEFFSNMGLTPPRGVLLHGYPGTGKTLIVRALIGSCAQGDKRIAYFARKGADCLGKYVGDAERQLRLLFQVAEKSQPSIIFFDEIDGLAPCRTRQQDQTHNSVVSTLLALMDGLKSRGSVVVIGATNRPDSVDPALRRPGRFDREIYFPLPSTQDREAILSLHTRKWPKPVTGSLLKQISRRTVGFAGADLQSLCTQAAITALRRSCPFQEILSAAEKNGPFGKHPSLPKFFVEERDWLEALRHAPPPCSQRGTEMAANDVNSSPLHTHLIPCLLQPLSVFLASLCRDKRISLPCPLYKAAMLVKSVVVSALDEQKIPGYNWWSYTHEILLKADVLRDVEIKLSRCGIVNGQASYSSSNVGNEEADGNKLESRCSKMQQISTRPNLWKNATCGSEKKVGFWLLISGSPRSGQRYLASCLLHCFTGNVEIVKLDSATISQEGQGDLMLGVTRILMKCASVGSSLIFMPRIDLWAIETYIDIDGDESDSSMKNFELPGQREDEVSEMATSEDVSQKTSVIWDIFVEQVESISVSSSLTILATSALPSEALPDGIKQFFKSGKSNNRSSSPFEETIPRFSIPLDGQFNYDSVINSSTTELSKDLVQQFVQLTHQRVHIHSSPYTNVNGCATHTLTGDADNHRPANEEVREQFPESSFTRFSSPANTRPSKGKSSLLLTISTLGYQILSYPHFAELCWATSKLKEGPCTSTRGPWKGWPFNSCIIRPDKSSENVAITSSSSNIKSKEMYGLVRGLIAVGLSAYRGMYTTVREVSSEVRKVLELLADKINAKIRAGKDPYQYIRLLSQMAYFEDVVHSWAYSLQSLEENSQATIPPTSGLSNLKSRDNKPFEDTTQKKPGDELDVSVKNSEETAEQKDGCEPAKNSDQMLEKSTQNLDLNEPMEEDNQNTEGRIFANEPPEQIMLCHSIQHDGNNPDPCTLKTSGNHLGDNGVCAPIMPNGFANTETVVINEADLCSGDSGTESPSTFKGFSNQRSEMTQEANISFENGNSSSIDGRNNVESNSLAGNESSLSNGSMVICFYRCCSECLIKLRRTIGKIITYEWGLRDDGDFTVEDVHDLVASVSMNLHSSLRKIFAAEWDKAEEKMKQNNFRGVFESQEKDVCQCKGSEDGFTRPKECRCHSTTNHISQLENDLKFICRDGVMSQLNPEEVTSLNFHCKYETICLCSLIEWIAMTKQPSS